MRIDGEDWVTAKEAAQRLGVAIKTVYEMSRTRRLRLRRVGPLGYARLAEVEAIATDKARIRRLANKARHAAGKQVVVIAEVATDLIDAAEAGRRLGVCRMGVQRLANRGDLTVYAYSRGREKHFFAAAQVEAIGVAREEKRMAKARQLMLKPPKRPVCSRVRFRKPLKTGGTIEVGDLSEWEKYFGDWITVRQTAWLLHNSRRSVYILRDNGRLEGRIQETLLHGRMQWHFRKKDVLALMGDDKYIERYRNYKRYACPEARERRRLEKEAAQAAQYLLEMTAYLAERETLPSGGAKEDLMARPVLERELVNS